MEKEYYKFFVNVKERIKTSQYHTFKYVNKELISLYWDIGRIIIKSQRDYNWGKSIVEQLSQDLNTEFPGIKGFSSANLWRMRLLYENYANNEILAQLVREIGWSHNIAILEWVGFFHSLGLNINWK